MALFGNIASIDDAKLTYYIIAAIVAKKLKSNIERKEIDMAKKFLKIFLAIAVVFAMFGSVISGATAPSGISMPCVSGFGNAVRLGDICSLSVSSGTRLVSSDYSSLKLYPGGVPFGVKFMTDGVIVTGFTDIKTDGGKICPATAAGLHPNDVILKINGETVTDALTLTKLTEECGGKALTVIYSRDGKEYTASLTPAYCKDEGKYKSGMFVRDSGAGIGTVTYIVPDTLDFGGLGHGICDADTGKLIPMQRGSVVGVTINGVVKGLSGTPGEVKGYFSSGKTGTLLSNTENGVFGAFATLPSGLASQPLPVGTRNELTAGKAYILSTLDGTTPQKYEIEICDIRLNSTSNKCFTVKVTDKALLEKSGGIVQGMSGSPIIQNGKLVGAVTHVLINYPTTGYGIFIENMINQSR